MVQNVGFKMSTSNKMQPRTILVALLSAAGVWSLGEGPYIAYPQAGGVPNIVLLQEDDSRAGPGCDQFAVYDIDSNTWPHAGAEELIENPPGRTTFDSGFTRFLAVNANHPARPASLTMFERPSRNGAQWRVSRIRGAEFLQKGDIAFLEDEDRFWVSIGNDDTGGVDERGAIAEYRLSDIVFDPVTRVGVVGQPLRQFELGALPSIIRLSKDRKLAHVIESSSFWAANRRSSRLRTFDISTLVEVSTPIDLGDLTQESGTGAIHAILSPDGFEMLINVVPDIIDSGQRYMIAADLVARKANWVQIAISASEMGTVGGIALNRAGVNRGVVAVHGGNYIRTYNQLSDGTFAAIGVVELPWNGRTSKQSTAWLDLDWSVDGHYIIAALVTDIGNEPNNFAVIRVTKNGRGLEIVRKLDTCLNGATVGGPWPMEVITANSLLPWPSPTPVAAATESLAPTCICEVVKRRVPSAVISDAVANPDSVEGWRQPLNPNRPPGPDNPLRLCLGLESRNLDYHPLFNKTTWLVGCQ